LIVPLGLLAMLYALLTQQGQLQRLDIDITLPVAELIAPQRPTPPIAIVVIDENTYRRPPFRDTPQVAWTPFIAEVLQAIDAAGARVVGLDLIYPQTLDQPGLLPGFDGPFLRALHHLGQSGRLVLGYGQGANGSISPYRGQIIAAGGRANLRPIDLLLDRDDVVRRYSASVPSSEGQAVTSFAVELARRFGAAPPAKDFLIDFSRNPASLPIYSLADLLECSRSGNADAFKQRFGDRIVLVGTALDVEDVHRTSRRFSFKSAAQPAEDACAERGSRDVTTLTNGRSIPGVFIHSAAVETILQGTALRVVPVWVNAALIGGVVALMTLVFLRQPPLMGAVFAAIALLAIYAASVLSISTDLLLPFIKTALAIAVTYVVTYAYRFVREQEARGRITFHFGRYLSPVIVERLADRRRDARLDGETRAVTIAFYDIKDFTTLSEQLQHAPKELIEIANTYLGCIADTIQQHRGYVDKFLGDGLMAIWGAPDHDPDAAAHAVDAALACQRRVEELNAKRAASGSNATPLQFRVGINSGMALVGNVGSHDRVNYTALGDMVNLASRLEGVNKMFGTSIIIGEATWRRLPPGYITRRLGRIAVKGKENHVRAYEVRDHSANDDHLQRLKFRNALATYYRRRIAEALVAFEELSRTDSAAKVYLKNCSSLASTNLPPGWDGTLHQ
jgi:class 3 adenylate cyclase/CHASE2 domain-containing sensor protein